jgi:hypothetical protein
MTQTLFALESEGPSSATLFARSIEGDSSCRVDALMKV